MSEKEQKEGAEPRETEETEQKKEEVVTSFIDKDGRVWNPNLTLPVIRNACRICNITLSEILGMTIPIDSVFVILWLSCAKQAAQRNLSEEDFEAAIGLEKITDAFLALAGAFEKSLPMLKDASSSPLLKNLLGKALAR